MEEGDNILETILEEDNLGDIDDDVEMLDVEEGELLEHDIEEGELLEHDSQNNSKQSIAVSDNIGADNQLNSKNNRRRGKKKKNKRKRKGSGSGSGSDSIDINRFVLNTCRRLKEKKSYMVYTAVGCLGVSALSDIIKEVDAIQACGGQKTADGRRFRTGGGVLWSILKVREPQAYKEIMKKAREFEMQFRQPKVRQPSIQKKEESSQGMAFTSVDIHQANVSESSATTPEVQDQHEPSIAEDKRASVHDRLRIPVSYDDDLLGLSVDNDAN